MLGNQRARGLTLFALAFAVACGNTDGGKKGGNTAGAAGTGAVTSGGSSGASGSASTAGSGNAAGSATAGSSTGGGDTGGPDPGAGGEAGDTAVTPPDQVEIVRDTVANKLDLLMMIDNSISMGDKQHLLADAMSHLVNRLLHPRCLDDKGVPTGQEASPGGVCQVGSQPEFLPFNDIHAAVITSSLGAHGASGAQDVCVQPDDDDHAQLLGLIRPGLPNWNQKGFLAWDPQQALTPVGISDAAELALGLSKTVEAAGDHGCGYEASLEAWYRFLIDPEPPATITVTQNLAHVTATSAEVLAQRADFLRSDSVLGIVMLSDENDCSIVDEGYGWLIPHSAAMFRSTSQCLTNPNDKCCQSCGEQAANAGCPAITNDTECAKGKNLDPNAGQDDLNLRCYHQKERFGFELLYPVQRYIDGLTSPLVKRRSDGMSVQNPIYQAKAGGAPRSAAQVLLLGIVGVPWQDVAEQDSLTGAGLKLLSEDGPLSAARWDIILGNPHASPPILPLDPFMVETPLDRTTLGLPLANPVVPAEKLVDKTSLDPEANQINGHESNNFVANDLQYACTFALPKAISCDAAANQAGQGCDCFDADLPYNRALCQPPGGGPASISQRYGKAYPGLRELEVLKGVGGHGIVASACAKTADLQSDSYGYRPAMDALAGRVANQLGRSCLNRDAKADANGRTACSVLTASSAATCTCPAAQGLSKPTAEAAAPVLAELEAVGYCGAGMPCDSICLCELAQLDGADLQACQTDEQAPDAAGFCYLDAVQGEVHAGNPQLAQDCVGAAPRRIRFSGDAPGAGKIALLFCPE